MLRSIGPTEWLIVGVVVLLIFGGKRIPELIKSLGEAIREFKRAADDREEKADSNK